MGVGRLKVATTSTMGPAPAQPPRCNAGNGPAGGRRSQAQGPAPARRRARDAGDRSAGRGRAQESRCPRLLADAMLGRLARWLRIMGCDTLYDPHWSDDELARRARAEGRLLLTRDRGLARRRGLHVVLIESERLGAQLAQVAEALGLEGTVPFSRCPVCNEPLEDVPHSEAWGYVPPYTFVTQREFKLCPACNRFYWRGTHCEQVERTLAEVREGRETEDG